MRRRRFLKLSLFSSLGLGLGLLAIGGTLAVTGLLGPILGPEPARLEAGFAAELRVLSGNQAMILRAAALRILDGVELAPPPGSAATPNTFLSAAEDGLGRHCLFVDSYLSGLERPLQSDVRSMLELLEYWPLLSGHASRFTRLPPCAQDKILEGWQSSRWNLLRQAFQGLKALCMLAHYQDERSFAAIGYTGPLVGSR